MEFIFYGKSILMFGLWIILHGKYEMPYNFKHLHYLNKPVTVQKYLSTSTSKIIIQIQASALPKNIYNNTKIFIHFNIKNNYLNIPIIFK